jgi:porin
VDANACAKSLAQRRNGSFVEVFGIQQALDTSTFYVVHLPYWQKLADDEVEFRIGRLGASDDFLVSPYNEYFVQNGFNGAPKGIFINAPGMSGYPNATWGTMLKMQATDRTYVMGGAYDGDTSIREFDDLHSDMYLDGPLFVIVELGYEHNQLPGDCGLVGNYKFGAWFDGNDFPDLVMQAIADADPGAGLPVSYHEGGYGFYGVFDQVFYRFSRPHERILRGIGVVGSIVVAPDQTVSRMPYFFNLGVVARGISSQRPRDSLGFGMVYGEFSSDLQKGQRAARLIDPAIGIQDHEIALELTYILRFRNEAYVIQLSIQYIVRPGGTGEIPNALVVGTQVGINF